MGTRPMGVGVVGCGNISGVYLRNLARLSPVRLVSCADLDPARASAAAMAHGLRPCSTEDLLADADVELVLNLTTPAAHASVAMAAVRSGKHVYNEKPLAIDSADASALLDGAARRGVLVGGAPDTFLGAGLSACRRLIDRGEIGRPVAATAFMLCRGHESWHPDPDFYYQRGGGPLFDMGPYYITALVALLGPVRRVSASAATSFSHRTITGGHRAGHRITVEVPTHVAAVLDFASGPVATLVTSFDVWAAGVPCLEIYGSEGSISAPDPNGFGGPVRTRSPRDAGWIDHPVDPALADNWRGLGVADLALAARTGAAPRASGRLAAHVLDVMHAAHLSSAEDRAVMLPAGPARPDPLPKGWADEHIRRGPA